MSLRERNIEKRRQRILEAARRLVEETGPESLKMRVLAKRAGFSVTTLYNLFGNKDDILVALLEQALYTVFPLLEAERSTEPYSAIQELMAGPVRYLLDNSRILRPILALLYYTPERRADPDTIAIYGEIIDTIAGFIAAAQKEGFLIHTLSPRLLAAELFHSYRLTLEDWSCREIDDEALSVRMQVTTLLLLLSAATDQSRESLSRRLEELQPRAINHLHQRFPALKA